MQGRIHYVLAPVAKDGTWGPDALVMTHSFQRHLLQVVW